MRSGARFFSLVLLCVVLLLQLHAYAADQYTVAHGATTAITEFTVCREVTNNHPSGLAIMVPTKFTQEWDTGGQSFIQKTPAGVVLNECGIPADAFVVVYDTTKSADGTTANEVLVRTGAGTFNYNVAWEDSAGATGSASGLTGPYTISGVASGLVTVVIRGTFPHFRNGGTRNGVVDVAQWGTRAWASMASTFANETELVGFTATDIPNLSAVANMGSLFQSATLFNQALPWNTSNVTTMNSMFNNATSFNQPLSFNTGNVTNMSYMFSNATAFNRPLSFDTFKVINMSYMFSNATSFNQPVSFDTIKVTNMASMFEGATSFNRSLGFDTSKVTGMASMFRNASAFNGTVAFNTSNVTQMQFMFLGASAFNQPVAFDTAKVTHMNYMFQNAASFNQPLLFDTSKATQMNYMFSGAVVFNQDLSNWCVPLLAVKPVGFDTTTTAWVKAGRQPVWGTCP